MKQQLVLRSKKGSFYLKAVRHSNGKIEIIESTSPVQSKAIMEMAEKGISIKRPVDNEPLVIEKNTINTLNQIMTHYSRCFGIHGELTTHEDDMTWEEFILYLNENQLSNKTQSFSEKDLVAADRINLQTFADELIKRYERLIELYTINGYPPKEPTLRTIIKEMLQEAGL